MPAPGNESVRYRDLLKDREFAGLYTADLLSWAGSYLGKFAVAALVYERTGSAGLTAAAFAASYLPYLVGGPLLATLADRWPRKQLLIAADLLRAALVLLILIPGVPIAAALVVIFAIECVHIPFGAARLAVMADILEGPRFALGNGLTAATQQAVQVGGFALGGLVVAVLTPRAGLVVDAVTYLVSALILATRLGRRPAPQPARDGRHRLIRDAVEGLRAVRDLPGMSRLFLLMVLGPAVLVTAEGLAIPYAETGLDGGPQLGGLLMAAAPLGSVFGLALMGRLPAAHRRVLTVPCAAGVGGLVAVAGAVPVPAVALTALLVAGVGLGYMTTIQADIVDITPTGLRGRVFGLANTALQLSQGLTVALAGILAERADPRLALVLSGLAGTALVVVGGVALGQSSGRPRQELPNRT